MFAEAKEYPACIFREDARRLFVAESHFNENFFPLFDIDE